VTQIIRLGKRAAAIAVVATGTAILLSVGLAQVHPRADPIDALIGEAARDCPAESCRASLTPHVFLPGELRAEVEQRLSEAGFSGAGGRYAKSETVHPQRLSTLTCDVVYVIEVEFDQASRVLTAFGDANSGCF
jgi:hypothetical protein